MTDPRIRLRIRTARNRSGTRCPKDFDSEAPRDALVHGPTVCTNTRRPPKLPASRRSGAHPAPAGCRSRRRGCRCRRAASTGGRWRESIARPAHGVEDDLPVDRGGRLARGRRVRNRLPRRALRRDGVELDERAARVHQRLRHADQTERRIGQAREPILGLRDQQTRAGAIPEADHGHPAGRKLGPAAGLRLLAGPAQVVVTDEHLADRVRRRIAIAEPVEHLTARDAAERAQLEAAAARSDRTRPRCEAR